VSPEPPDIFAILERCTGFDWDAGNAPKVLARHNVQPGECEQVFFQEPLLVAFEATHSGGEARWQALGRTGADRRLYVVFTIRGSVVRVVAARDLNRKERRRYAEAETGVEENPGL